MENRFKEGQKLHSVNYGSEGKGGYCIDGTAVERITVVMENGQMAGVPWALVKLTNMPDVKVNLALCVTVELL